MLYRARSSGEISVGQIEARNNLHCPGTKYVILLEHLVTQLNPENTQTPCWIFNWKIIPYIFSQGTSFKWTANNSHTKLVSNIYVIEWIRNWTFVYLHCIWKHLCCHVYLCIFPVCVFSRFSESWITLCDVQNRRRMGGKVE